MLLCDGCDRGFHMYCLKPALKKIPKGTWYCPECKKEKKKREKEQQELEAEEEEEMEVSEEEIEENESVEDFEPVKKSRKRSSTVQNKEVPQKKKKKSVDNKQTSTRGRPSVGKTPKEEPSRRSSSRAKKSTARKQQWEEDKQEEEEEEQPQIELLSKLNARQRRSVNMKELQKCKQLLEKIIKEENAWPFMDPVNKKEVPDYYEVVEHPMHLKKIKKKIQQDLYNNPGEFMSDVLQVFANCRIYNDKKSEYYKIADELEDFFREQAEQLGIEKFIPEE